jgi:glucan phosphorylase
VLVSRRKRPLAAGAPLPIQKEAPASSPAIGRLAARERPRHPGGKNPGRPRVLRPDATAWARKALLTVSRMGRFSSDRTIQDYAEEIWTLKPVL